MFVHNGRDPIGPPRLPEHPLLATYFLEGSLKVFKTQKNFNIFRARGPRDLGALSGTRPRARPPPPPPAPPPSHPALYGAERVTKGHASLHGSVFHASLTSRQSFSGKADEAFEALVPQCVAAGALLMGGASPGPALPLMRCMRSKALAHVLLRNARARLPWSAYALPTGQLPTPCGPGHACALPTTCVLLSRSLRRG